MAKIKRTGPLIGHVHAHDALGIAVGGTRFAGTQVSETLVQAGLKRQAKGLAQRELTATC